MSLISMFTRSRISEGPKPSPFEPDRPRSPQRAYKDYSTRLVSVSWHQLDDEGAAARIASDFNNDFLWIRGPDGFQGYYHRPDAVKRPPNSPDRTSHLCKSEEYDRQ